MRPDQRALDEEIRGHLALAIKERVDRGEDPAAARRAALAEFGYVPAARESMRRVWYGRWFDAATALGQDLRVGLRSLRRAKGLSATVVLTLALGIGANAAIVSVVGAVLLRPLVNRDDGRLVYIRQSAPGLKAANTTFSVPEIADLKSRVTTIAAFGEFSTIDFTLLGLGEPRVVRAGVVDGSYFEVMGLRPALGRLLDARDDGPRARGAVVLTHRFWTTALASDPSAVGTAIQLGPRAATIVGVLEPSVPYPTATEIIANIVSSPHHLDATMTTVRTHRMTEVFGRLADGATVEEARADLERAHVDMVRHHGDAYPPSAGFGIAATPLREQITKPARTPLLLLLASAGLVFLVACSNVANLILARSVQRESELAVRASLGASRGALRRTLLAESLLLCGVGAGIGVWTAGPMVSLVSAFASRFSVRALDVAPDASVIWVSAALALAAALVLAYVPRLPDGGVAPARGGARSSGRTASRDDARRAVRVDPGTHRRLGLLASTQVALTFVILVAAGTLLSTFVALQSAETGYDTGRVLALDLPTFDLGLQDAEEMHRYDEMSRRIRALPGVESVAMGNFVPWRDAGMLPRLPFAIEGRALQPGEEFPHAQLRIVSPGFFATLGIELLRGRDFTGADRLDTEQVVVVSQSIASRLFPRGEALNRTVQWIDPLFGPPTRRRIVGVVADVNDEAVAGDTPFTIYHPIEQLRAAGRLFIQTSSRDPYEVVAAATRIIRHVSVNQAVDRPATLADIRADVLAPERVNAIVLAVCAVLALVIAAIGIAGVLAFSVSARTREFGVRLAMGSTPRLLLVRVLAEGARIVAPGVVVGAMAAWVLALAAARSEAVGVQPGALATLVAVGLLAAVAVAASLIPAARAARVDVVQALRTE